MEEGESLCVYRRGDDQTSTQGRRGGANEGEAAPVPLPIGTLTAEAERVMLHAGVAMGIGRPKPPYGIIIIGGAGS